MNTSLRGQARFPAILLPLNRPFQISIHGIGTVMNKKTSFKFNRTKAGQRREMEGRFCACGVRRGQQLAIMQNTATPPTPPHPPTRPPAQNQWRRQTDGTRLPDRVGFVISCASAGAGESQSSIPFAIKTVHNCLGSPRQPAN